MILIIWIIRGLILIVGVVRGSRELGIRVLGISRRWSCRGQIQMIGILRIRRVCSGIIRVIGGGNRWSRSGSSRPWGYLIIDRIRARVRVRVVEGRLVKLVTRIGCAALLHV